MNENETQDIAKEMIVHFDEVEQLSETAQEITNNASKHYLYRVKRSIIKELNCSVPLFDIKKPLKWWLENNYATINELERCLD